MNLPADPTRTEILAMAIAYLAYWRGELVGRSCAEGGQHGYHFLAANAKAFPYVLDASVLVQCSARDRVSFGFVKHS